MTTPQKPIHSHFNADSTADQVMAGIDLHGTLAIVTGGYSGIGLVTAKSLAGAGARVIVPARDPARAHAALGTIEGVEVLEMDLLQPASVAAFSQRLIKRGQAISLLINCAGVMAAPLSRDADGHESQFATNHLGHYRLTCGLWPALVAADAARVIAMSSRGHQIAGVDFDDIDFMRRPYDKWQAYGQSKTANALFAKELDKRGRDQGVRAFSLHPGQILTELGRHLSPAEIAAFDVLDEHGQQRLDPQNGLKTLEQGAATGLWCATSKALTNLGGVYCEDCNIAPLSTPETGRKGVATWAVDPEYAQRLWAVSEQWTGMTV
ncbi:NAD(P)-dependent dehydrogenase (short-subunit alcohol dehydrogenase family) [Pseudomonas sp. JUb42]|uniref:oxidoreductase n=1 Tax=Pseudomonas sp. JUb42 TaxID=2940611 RepID=UPI002168BB52|nr:oxidoreductase [Pseudomonas sp. JUb42]MCS3471425.1 NAD(P)-dependent dehydrogenase (short-subunit alcohol dehydrogenase family) [Pseudomonas sp. JUb42]